MPNDIQPALTDLGALLRARTRSDTTGAEAGTFNTTTRPTGTEVSTFIDAALTEVELWLPDDIPARVQPFAKHLVALRAAMLIELSYDPDRSGTQDSTYAQLKQMYEDGKAALLDSLSDRDQGVTRRIGSMPIVSPTLAPYPDDLREIMAPDPWPYP